MALRESLVAHKVDYFNTQKKKPNLIQIIADNREKHKVINRNMPSKGGSVRTLPIGSERSIGTEAFKARYFKNGA